MIAWLVTTQVDGDPRRTRDHRIAARSAWAAGWLWRQLHPDQTVVMVREVKR